MFRRKSFMRIFVGVLLVAVLIFAGSAFAYRMGVSYGAGLEGGWNGMMTEGTNGNFAFAHGYGHGGYMRGHGGFGFGGFGFFGMLLQFFFFLFLFKLAIRFLFFPGMMHRMAHHRGRHYGPRWWGWDDDEDWDENGEENPESNSTENPKSEK